MRKKPHWWPGIVLILSVSLVAAPFIGLLATHATSSDLRLSQPHVIMEVLDPSLAQFAPEWRDEICRRFNNAVGVLVHGGQLEAGRWVVGTTMYGEHRLVTIEEVIQFEQRRWPNRTLVILACNVEHTVLQGHSNVFYSHSSVWAIPDRFLYSELIQDGADRIILGSRWEENPEVVGNIWEFMEAN